MHLRRLNLEHFKGLRALEVSFLRESGAVRPLTLLLGANGSGKTSVLQAIAFVLSLATRKIAEPGAFNWPGFLLERMSSGGPTRVELEVGFDPEELTMLPALFARWRSSVRPDLARSVVQPDAHPTLTLVYEDGALRCAQGDGGLSQCLGRYFAAALVRHPPLQSVQPQPGAVFWYHQHRNLFMTDSLQGIEPHPVARRSNAPATRARSPREPAARDIAYYTAARWILGLHRKEVDSQRLFSTRPVWKNEIKVPEALSCEASRTFLLGTLHDWKLRITCPADDELRQRHGERAQALRTLDSAEDVLLWHGGKDLLAALEPQIRARHRIDPKTFSHRIRDWIYDRKADALSHLPEWTALFRSIAAES